MIERIKRRQRFEFDLRAESCKSQPCARLGVRAGFVDEVVGLGEDVGKALLKCFQDSLREMAGACSNFNDCQRRGEPRSWWSFAK